jgi:hypothetical protein
LDDGYVPRTSLFAWTGSTRLGIDGDPVQFSIAR